MTVLGPIDGTSELSGLYITAVGSNVVREEIVRRVDARYRNALQPWTLIHPRSFVGDEVEIGKGTCVAPGAIMTARAKIGSHCIVNVNASVSHDCVIGDFVNLNPGAIVCGSVTIGEGAYIGAGAVLRDGISIGAWAVLGAGSVVVRDIPPHVTAFGSPAHVMRRH
jgi:sugar O-acyltransferase (sialic acid O-acetyltransferase NeuD family)